MKVAELIEKLLLMRQDVDVLVRTETDTVIAVDIEYHRAVFIETKTISAYMKEREAQKAIANK